MREKIEAFYDSLNGKNVAFIGIGVTNMPCIDLFAKHGANITLCDKKADVSQLCCSEEWLCERNVTLSLGDGYLEGIKNKHIIMRTPGFAYFSTVLQNEIKNGALVTSEMELFMQLCPCPIIAITGSDGKTTTSTLIAKMLEDSGKNVHLGGNIGRALLPIVHSINESDIAVVELSSFQLCGMKNSPHIAVVTNVTPNHLDHHKDMQEYIDAKRNILLYQSESDIAILGFSNEISHKMQEDVKGELRFFTRHSKVQNGAYLREDNMLCYEKNGVVTPLIHKKDIALIGEHNVENVLTAAAAIFHITGAKSIAKIAQNFTGVEHRIEPVRKVNGIMYYNNSIATSPTRVIAGLNAFSQKLIIIAGGSDKGISYEPLATAVFKSVKVIVLMGQTADKIESTIKNNADFAKSELIILRATDMQDAVNKATAAASEGDIISLSPACASFDMYANFEAKGRHFKEIVNAL